MLKPTKVNLADTNLALFGTDTEKKSLKKKHLIMNLHGKKLEKDLVYIFGEYNNLKL